MNALIFGMSSQIITVTAAMLTRAGFNVDGISSDQQILRCKYLANSYNVENMDQFIKCVQNIVEINGYQLYVPTEDRVLELLITSNLSPEEKVKILPVSSGSYNSHLYSKIKLSESLAAGGISTPDFSVANDRFELQELDQKTDRPYFIKKDKSGGGAGVFLVEEGHALRLKMSNLSYPALVQKHIEGDLLDLSGFYFKNQLIYFHCSKMVLCRPGRFGLSILRRYYKSKHIGEGYYRDLSALGHVLGIDGFANISAVRSKVDGKLYFIEADLRPNLWIEHGLFIGEDPADYLRDFFVTDRLDMPKGLAGYGYHLDESQSLEVPLYCRMTEKEASENAYNCSAFRRDYHETV